MKHAEMSQRYVTYLSRPSTCSAVPGRDSRLVSWTALSRPLSDSRRETGSAICYGRANTWPMEIPSIAEGLKRWHNVKIGKAEGQGKRSPHLLRKSSRRSQARLRWYRP